MVRLPCFGCRKRSNRVNVLPALPRGRALYENMDDQSVAGNSNVVWKSRESFKREQRRKSVFLTPTTLFSDSHITPSKEYTRVVDPQRRRLLFVLFFFVIISPLMFRYACGSSNVRGVDSTTIPWASGVDGWEWSVMLVLWLGILGSIFRLLPMVSGRPAAVESSQQCRIDGMAALGLVSPFSSEDDAILLRSLLGRTCTALHTVGSRHSMQGLYLDAILNERRIKGEANRRNCWLAWMKFLNALVDVSLLMKEESIITPETGRTPSHLRRRDAISPPPGVMSPQPETPAGIASPGSPIQKVSKEHYMPSAAASDPHRKLYVQGTVNAQGVPYSTAHARQSGNYTAVAPPAVVPEGTVARTSSVPVIHPRPGVTPRHGTTPRHGLTPLAGVSPRNVTSPPPARQSTTFRDIGLSLDSTMYVSEGQRGHITSWSRDQQGARPLSIAMTIAQLPESAAHQQEVICAVNEARRAGMVPGYPGSASFATSEKDLISFSNKSGQSSARGMHSRRALYVEGVVGPNGVATPTPRNYRVSWGAGLGAGMDGDGNSGGHSTPSSDGPPFKILSEVLESTLNVTSAQRSRVTSWSREEFNNPLSNGFLMATPRRFISFKEHVDVFSPEARSEHGSSDSAGEGFGGQDQKDDVDRSVFSGECGIGARAGAAPLAPLQRPAPPGALGGPDDQSSYVGTYSTPIRQFSDPSMSVLHQDDGVSEIDREPGFSDNPFDAVERGEVGPYRLQREDDGSDTSESPGDNNVDMPMSIRRRSARIVSQTAAALVNFVSTAATDLVRAIEKPASPVGDAELGTPKGQLFPMTPTDRPRPVTPKQSMMASSYLRPHSIPNLELNMADIIPLIDFLDAWLEEMKTNEWTYDYQVPKNALEKLFFACPFMSHFKGHHMLAVHAALDALYTAFTTQIKDEPDPKRPYHPDEVSEVEWVLRRQNLPDWTVVWSYASRARLREMKRSDISDPYGPDPVYQSTRIKPGAIVYRLPPVDVIAECIPMAYFRTRRSIYKVDFIKPSAGPGKPAMAYVIPFCPPPSTSACGVDSGNNSNRLIHAIFPLDELVLLEKNRGKTGALNFFNEYLRTKTIRYSRSHGVRRPIQTFTGIVDARHALVETDIFWNDALPYFARVESTGKPGKRFGGLTEHSICITVQYPQYFTNVGDDDVLDNTNSTYYNLWQTLRDGAKCICSSGTNAIWDISNPAFEFCTTSRSEDLGTSHEYIPHCAAVYLCIYVAFGIAKKTEDFLEALYRWSAGPLELLWPSFFQWRILKHYIITAVPTTVMALASFHESNYWYWAHLFVVGLFVLKGCLDRLMGRKPLRDFVVSTVVSINLFIVCSNLMSVMWLIVFPTRIAFWGVLPLGRTDTQGMFWAWISLFVSLSTGIVHDALIRIARHTAPGTKLLNYDNCLWRGSQLYANSFMFTLMATIGGSWSAFKAWWWDYDLSMWSSFRVSNSEFDKLRKGVANVSICSAEYRTFLWQYVCLYTNSCLAALTMPTVMTKWYVSAIFIHQIVCIFVSTFIVNRDEVLILVVLVFSCSLNILMTIEVAMLLQPLFHLPFGYPFRVDYALVAFGLVVLGYCIAQNALSYDSVLNHLRLGPFVGELESIADKESWHFP